VRERNGRPTTYTEDKKKIAEISYPRFLSHPLLSSPHLSVPLIFSPLLSLPLFFSPLLSSSVLSSSLLFSPLL